MVLCYYFFFFFQAEDGIRDRNVTGVQTCALPIYLRIGARAESLSELGAELQLYGRLRKLQRLQVGVRGNELDAFQLGANHAVHRVASATPHADDFDLRRLQFFAETHANSRVSSHHILSASSRFAAPRGQGHEAPANMAFSLDTRVPERCGPDRRAFAPASTSPTTVAYSG